MAAPLDLAPVADRLREQAGSALREVGLAAELEPALEQARVLPAAYVLPASDQVTQRRETARLLLQVETTVTVLVGLRHFGQAGHDELRSLRAQVWQALLGWQPPGAELPLQYRSGQRAVMERGAQWWEEQFTTSYWITQ